MRNVGFSLSHRTQHLGPTLALKTPWALSLRPSLSVVTLLPLFLIHFLSSPASWLKYALSHFPYPHLDHVSIDYFGPCFHYCDSAEHRHRGASSFGGHDPKPGRGFITGHDPRLLVRLHRFRTTTRPSISWAPCEHSALLSELRPTDYMAPPPSPTSSAGTHTPPALPSSMAPCPPSPLPPPSLSSSSPPVPPPSPLPAYAASSSPPPLSFPPSPALSPPDFASAPRAPLPSRTPPSPPPFPTPSSLPASPCPPSDTSWDDDWSTKDDNLLLSLKYNERLRPSWRYISPAKCSAPNLRSALVGLNFLNYSDWPHHDVCL